MENCLSSKSRLFAAAAAFAAGLLVAAASLAQTTDIANEPLFTGNGAKPNIMFIMDDSSSMDWEAMPDDAGGIYMPYWTYGRRASQCNGLAYNPSINYSPPLDENGVRAANAPVDYFLPNPLTQLKPCTWCTASTYVINSTSTPPTAGTTMTVVLTDTDKADWWFAPQCDSNGCSQWYPDEVTLYGNGDSTHFVAGYVRTWDHTTGELVIVIDRVVGSGTLNRWGYGQPSSNSYFTYSGTVPAMSWRFSGSGTVLSTNLFNECTSAVGSAPGSSVFTEVTLTAASPVDQQQNMSNWFRYYRSRLQMTRTSLSLAFATLNDKFRIGFSTIHNKNATEPANAATDPDVIPSFVHVRDFDLNQKKLFFKAVNGAGQNGGTPLRGALSRAGRYFANKVSGQTYDPVQHTCQRNYAILATDGYWNTDSEGLAFGPYGLDGSPFAKVDNQDSTLARPMLQASTATNGKNLLADVAAYYYKPLRDPSRDNCMVGNKPTGTPGYDACTTRNVPSAPGSAAQSGGDTETSQHMTTFTIGLGVGGTLNYDPNYLTQTSGDFFNILNGTANWPDAQAGSPTTVDDLWHAGVNGHGQYFSAKNPGMLVGSLKQALNSITRVTTGGASAAATSSLQPVVGNNNAYAAQFTSGRWTGELLSYQVDISTGALNTLTWSAASNLAARNFTTNPRKILYKGKNAGTLVDFNSTNLNSDGYDVVYFKDFCNKSAASGMGAPDQCAGLNNTELAAANAAANLIGYLRGEQPATPPPASYYPYYRRRAGILGDIINGSPLFVPKKPNFIYTDAGYATFISNTSRPYSLVLTPANDGMLHAFRGDTGEEVWAFVPTTVLSNMYKLADNGYQSSHSYFVDGSPQLGDIYVGGQWKTIVVGGLNAGGRAYYALDVTDPANPKFLWEFTDPNLGLTFGNPVITKRSNGKWVVVFASGYNNVSPGDGEGRLFVVDANTGVQEPDSPIKTNSTGGIARINAWVDSDRNNQALRFYGGDTLGNLWRFDIDNRVQPYKSALLLATLKSGAPDYTAQPITVRPALAEILQGGTSYPVAVVGTGRYLGATDIKDTKTQSIYVIKDPLANTSYGNPRTGSLFVPQALSTNASTTKTITLSPINWSTQAGWYADLGPSERVTVDPLVAVNSFYVAGNIISQDVCRVGGDSYVYGFDIGSGRGLDKDTPAAVGSFHSGILTLGLSAIKLGSRTVQIIETGSDGSINRRLDNIDITTRPLVRAGWRELK
jgi:type IV pilus assembly protein PilY1